jgi:co-chaperonin GroES (HSP10)
MDSIEVTQLSAIPGRVIIQQKQSASKVGSFYVPRTAREPTNLGMVVSVGAGIDNLVPGDLVIFETDFGRDVKIEDGHEYRDLEPANILAVLKGEE